MYSARTSPRPHNRVSLDPGLTDGDGVPAPKVEYAIGENSLRMMAHGVDRASELMKAAGAGDVAVNPQLEPAGGHLMGTARMGADGSTSVVDGWGRAHDVRNLFIIDGSTWVTRRRGQPDVHDPGAGPPHRRLR